MGKGSVQVTGLTDSMVATMVLGRDMTSSFPLCLCAMEAAAQLEARGLVLSLDWIPREQNQEADALSNLCFDGFAPGHRIQIDVANLPFLVLPLLMAEAIGFFGENERKRGLGLTGFAPQRARKEDSLRFKDPW